MATRLQNENNCEVGVFSKLTNAYCLVAIGGSENFYMYHFYLFFCECRVSVLRCLRVDVLFGGSTFEAELAHVIPVVKTSIAGTRIIGRLCAGNKNGLLAPQKTTDQGRCMLLNPYDQMRVLEFKMEIRPSQDYALCVRGSQLRKGDHPYPPNKLIFVPDKECQRPNLQGPRSSSCNSHIRSLIG
ncbi:eukaryotic translation initiation factor 6 [Striga asiatica]|uniref:Eukaryotic translation initiation factor 6 n=1 Tax=Striga asiatica TaxID=4170 RepID=A0A5A7PQS2_STRAF|nr:eukaryotic translation initiation factor 6 [Striga asiatica]